MIGPLGLATGPHPRTWAFVLATAFTAAWALLDVHGAGADGRNLRPSRLTSLYGPARPRLRAAHDHAAHRALPCTACHGNGGGNGGGAPAGRSFDRDSLAPTKAQCERCHADAHAVQAETEAGGSREQGVQSACERCHLDAAPPYAKLPPAAPRSRQLRFAHARHQATPCQDCHGLSSGAASTYPSMAQCLDCHRKRGQATACSACHATQPDGRLVTRFDAGVLVPEGPLLGMAHDRDWLVRHRWVGADQGPTCAGCHAERDCEQCHDAPRPPRRVHRGDFLSLHPQQARRAPASCTSCHTVQSFCAECHARLGLALGSAPSVGATGRVHPNPATWTRAGGHGIAARRNLSACVSCHAESDCVPCHGGEGVGTGLSPHGADFRNRCAALQRANERACRTCHGSATPPCR